MVTRKDYQYVWIVVALLIITITVGCVGNSVQASGLHQENDPSGVTIPYPGYLADGDGLPVPNGDYAFTFTIYDAEVGGKQLWVGSQERVPVRDGAFEVSLTVVGEVLDQGNRWIEISVRGPDEVDFTLLSPRLPLNTVAPLELTSPAAGAACPHDHYGEVWSGSVAWSNGAFKVINYGNGPSIWGWNSGGGNALRGYGAGNSLGVYAESQDNAGAVGRSTNGNGVEGYSTNGYGVFAHSDNDDSIFVDGAGANGVRVASAGDHGVYVDSAGWMGVGVWSASVAGMWVHSANQDGILVDTAGWDGVHVTGPVGGSYYGAGMMGAEDFTVLNTGEVRSKVGFSTPSSGFAQILPITGIVADYEAGDVIVMGDTGEMRVALAEVQSSPTVIGVYANSAGFLGGQSVVTNEAASGIAVTIMGIVPVKVSAENGSIQPGDLLVTSSTPGHAMRADNPKPGTILGKALEPLDEGTGIILVLLLLQ